MRKQFLLFMGLVGFSGTVWAQQSKSVDSKELLSVIEAIEDGVLPEGFLSEEKARDHIIQIQVFHKGAITFGDWENDTIYFYYGDTDLVDWLATNKTEYAYNDDSEMIVQTNYIWENELNDWEASVKYIHDFDDKGDYIGYTYQRWDSDLSAWGEYQKHTYTIDANGNTTQDLYEKWSSSEGAYTNHGKHDYTFNAENLKTEYVYTKWDSGLELWENYKKEEYSYDADGHLTMMAESDWDDGLVAWVYDVQFSYTYDASGNMIYDDEAAWDETNSVWENDTRKSYAYNSEGLVLENGISYWDADLSAWESPSSNMVCEYNSNGDITLKNSNFRDETSSVWYTKEKYVYTYIEDGLLLNIDFYFDGSLDTQPYHYFQQSFTYDEYGNRVLVLNGDDWAMDGEITNGMKVVCTWTTELKDQTITFDAIQNVTYGDSDFSLAATADSDLEVMYTVISGPAKVSTKTLSITGVGEVTIEATQEGNESYHAAPAVRQTFTVEKARLRASADAKSIVYGEALPTLTSVYSGFVMNERSSVLTTLPTLAVAATEESDAGTYDISVSGGVADNYEFTYVDADLVIAKAMLTATVRDTIRDPGESYPEFEITFSGFVKSQDVSVIEELPFVSCDADENSDAGTYDITLSGGADENYEFTFVNGTLTVNQSAGVNDVSKEVTFKVYPNPATDYIYIENLSNEDVSRVEIFNQIGQKVYDNVGYNLQVNVQDFPIGFYIMVYNKTYSTSFIKI